MYNGENAIDILEDKIAYHFKNRDYIRQALTHSSYANERKINKTQDYERIEFLGDAVLELVSSDFLYKENPTMPEGQLTKLRASMVCEPALAFCARDISLGDFIRLGRGEAANGGSKRDSITSDVMEAVIGAIYLDGGFEPARDFVHRFILSDLENKQLFYDSKSTLQEIAQGTFKKDVIYTLLAEEGPEHDKKFLSEVMIENVVVCRGSGRTKKAAEQKAAYEALLELRDKGYVFKKH